MIFFYAEQSVSRWSFAVNDNLKVSNVYSLPYCFISYHTIPHITISYYTIPYRTIPYHIIPYHTIPYHTIPYHTIPYHTIPYQPYHTTLHHTISYHTTPLHKTTHLSKPHHMALKLFVLNIRLAQRFDSRTSV